MQIFINRVVNDTFVLIDLSLSFTNVKICFEVKKINNSMIYLNY